MASDPDRAAVDVSAMLDAWLASVESAAETPAPAAAETQADPTSPPPPPVAAEATETASPPLRPVLDETTSDTDSPRPVPIADEPVAPAPEAPVLVTADAGRAPASLLEAVAELERQAPEPDSSPARAVSVVPQDHPRYVLFTIAGAHYSVEQGYVTELDRVPNITLVPNVPAWVRGITNRRGDILSVVDTRALLGVERLGAGVGRMLVVRLLDDSCALGLLVDDVQQIVSVAPDHVRAAGSGLEGPLAPFLTGLFELGSRTVAVLDVDRFLRSPLIRQFDEPADKTQGED